MCAVKLGLRVSMKQRPRLQRARRSLSAGLTESGKMRTGRGRRYARRQELTSKRTRKRKLRARKRHAIDLVAERSLSFEDGYRKGKYDGGEAVLAQLYPENMILPDIPVEHVIALGFEQVRHLLKPLVETDAIYLEIQAALQENRPLSIVRLGDGELLALAHDTVLSADLVLREGAFLEYSGIEIPAHQHRDQLAEAVRHATFVGIPTARAANYYGLLLPVLKAHGISIGQMQLTYSIVNYSLAQQGFIPRILEGRKVLLVGNIASELAHILAQHGISVAGIVTPVRGMRDIPRVLEEVAIYQYDIALVAAGIPAVILCQQIAALYGKVALDFGHLANKLASGEAAFL